MTQVTLWCYRSLHRGTGYKEGWVGLLPSGLGTQEIAGPPLWLVAILPMRQFLDMQS